ncbi:uncharacterized protein IWZ02DRAFT_456770 [Phyllosticta citriasiana]|uniref:Uncharacterized protein n=1 Tax=Phyllosticta citriasiana TaxID=595635 RepID=A0ABR1K7W4_9PEZI
MIAPRALALLTAALSTTVAAVGSANVVNNCAFALTATMHETETSQILQGQFSIPSGGSQSAGEHSTNGWRINMWKDDSPGVRLGYETRLQGNTVFYDVYEDGGSPVGDAFAMTSTDGACHGIQGGQGNFDPVMPDTYTCTSDASFTLTLCP